MLRKLRTLLIGLLLVPVLTMNANAFAASAELSGLSPPQQVSGVCWVYYMGRWWQLPC